MLSVTERNGAVTFAVRVHPGARREGFAGLHDGAAKIDLPEAAEDGRANDALVRLVARLLRIPLASVTILRGHSSRSKLVQVAGVTVDELRSAFAPEAC